MEKIISKNEKIYLIYGGQKFRKDSDLAGGGSSWRCVKPACRGRMKISVDDEVFSSTEHNHAPEPEIKKAQQTTTSDSNRMNHRRKWMLVEPREPLSKIEEILFREANPYLKRNKAKDVAVQTEPDTAKDFSWNSQSLKISAQKPDAWKPPALKDATVVHVRITDGKRKRLNKEYVWNRY